ncbi:MAG: DMT family transporter [Parvibaculaceae bacterium]
MTDWTNRLPAPVLAILAIAFIQLGTATAKDLMTAETALSLLFLRLFIGSILLLPFLWSDIFHLSRAQWRDALLLGLVYGGFSTSVYWALDVLPLGLVATIGFLGPLMVSLAGARRALDVLWPGLGFAGVLLLAPLGTAGPVTFTGLLFGLLYAAMWAFYILTSAKAGGSLPNLTGFALATTIAALVVAPFGASGAGQFLTSWTDTLKVMAVAFLSTYPFAMEFLALKRIAPRIYGVLLSLEPGIAALIGLVLLSELLDARGWIALVMVSIAATGATLMRNRTGKD